MTREQFKILAKAMKAVYAQPTFLPDQDAFNVWYSLLSDIDYEKASNAVQKVMMQSPFPPTISDIRAAAASFSPSCAEAELPELEAWQCVMKAVRNSNYNSEEEYKKLPETIQTAVGNPANLREWAQMDTETVNTVEQSHFIRAYRTAVKQKMENQKLSPAMRELMEKMTHGQISAKGAGMLEQNAENLDLRE